MASIGQKLGSNEPLATPSVVAGLRITPARLRYWGIKSALSLVDQGFTSGAGFLVNLLLARWMPAPVYGAFAVAFAGYLFVAGFHNVLLLEPMSVLGPSQHAANLPEYFRAQLKIHGLLVGALSAVVLVASAVVWMVSPASPLVGAMVGSGLALPLLLLLWLVRRMCYVVQRPSIAVGGSAFYFAFVAAGLLVLARLGWLGSFTAFVLMGAGSAAAAALLWFGVGREAATAVSPPIPWGDTLRASWNYGRWLTGSTVMSIIGMQAQTFVVAGVLGLASAGVLRALQLPSLVMMQMVAAATLLVLPKLSYDHRLTDRQRFSRTGGLTSIALGAVALAYAAMLYVLHTFTERTLFAGRYHEHAHLIWLLALVPAANGFGSGFSMMLRVRGRADIEFGSYCAAAVISLVSVVLFTKWWGLTGAAVSLVVSSGVLAASNIALYRIWGRMPNAQGDS